MNAEERKEDEVEIKIEFGWPTAMQVAPFLKSGMSKKERIIYIAFNFAENRTKQHYEERGEYYSYYDVETYNKAAAEVFNNLYGGDLFNYTNRKVIKEMLQKDLLIYDDGIHYVTQM